MARTILIKLAPGVIAALILCGALTGCAIYPARPFVAVYPGYGAPPPVVVVRPAWGWRRYY